jgi:hypothetical protein
MIGLSAAAAAALLGIGTEALGNAGAILPSQYERENKKQLKALEAQRAQGNLGLSSREKDALRAQRAAPLAAEAQRAQNELTRMSANSGLTGQGLQTQASLATRTAAIKDAVEGDIQVQDLARARQQEEEYWARLAAQSQAQQERRQAVANVALTGAGAYQAEDAAKRLREGTIGDRDAAKAIGITSSAYKKVASQLTPEVMAEIEEYLK